MSVSCSRRAVRAGACGVGKSFERLHGSIDRPACQNRLDGLHEPGDLTGRRFPVVDPFDGHANDGGFASSLPSGNYARYVGPHERRISSGSCLCSRAMGPTYAATAIE